MRSVFEAVQEPGEAADDQERIWTLGVPEALIRPKLLACQRVL
jgi:hypothetical protein